MEMSKMFIGNHTNTCKINGNDDDIIMQNRNGHKISKSSIENNEFRLTEYS